MANYAPKDYLGKSIMVVGESVNDAYTEFSAAAAERRIQGGAITVKGAKKIQRPPTNVDGTPPALSVKVSNASGAPWLLGSDVKANNGIVPAAKPESLAAIGPKLGGAPSRFGTIRSGSAESGGYLSRAASLAPPREGPSRGMSISRSGSSAAHSRAVSVSPGRGVPDLDAAYDDILGDYGAGPTRALSTKGPMSSWSALNASRGLQRQKTMASTYSRSRAMSVYDEDGEAPLRLIKVKVRREFTAIYPQSTHIHTRAHTLTPFTYVVALQRKRSRDGNAP
jgi:hypothetical protein